MNKKSDLSARKAPSQARSKKMVEGILNATRKLLIESNDRTVSDITTIEIARAASISVGSLYQYFPNKEAILFELYGQMLNQVSTVLKIFKTEKYMSLPRERFFDLFTKAIKGAESDAKFVIEMHHAMQSNITLAKADKHHAELIASELAIFMKHFGSKWPIKKLQRLSLHIYYINHGSWLYREYANPPSKEVNEWEIDIINHMIAKCFD